MYRKISTKNFPKTQTTARTTTGTIITNFYLRLTKRDGDQRDMVKSRNCLCVAPLLPAPLVAQSWAQNALYCLGRHNGNAHRGTYGNVERCNTERSEIIPVAPVSRLLHTAFSWRRRVFSLLRTRRLSWVIVSSMSGLPVLVTVHGATWSVKEWRNLQGAVYALNTYVS